MNRQLLEELKMQVPDMPMPSAILDENKQVVECHFLDSVFWMAEDPDRVRLAQEEVNGYKVSTVFSCVPLNGYITPRYISTTHLPRATQKELEVALDTFDEGDGPDWFETMVFGPDETYTFNRYRNYAEALRGHKACVTDITRMKRNESMESQG